MDETGLFGLLSENAGFLALNCVGSQRVVQISSEFILLFSILGKFGADIASIPAPALYCIFFAYVGSAASQSSWACLCPGISMTTQLSDDMVQFTATEDGQNIKLARERLCSSMLCSLMTWSMSLSIGSFCCRGDGLFAG
ncbi:unnamed protein product [Coffea canephora]|uniref:DH200=94 genomic scaffold, scaffold_390 n=1 Tax=Coffea canephora TaxID=49390 RepID=A0A068VFD9_COFCA|nr:unnamed protein product [Coffea canephora]